MTSNVMRPSSLNDWKFLPLASRWLSARPKAKAKEDEGVRKEEARLETTSLPGKSPRDDQSLIRTFSELLSGPSLEKAHVDH